MAKVTAELLNGLWELLNKIWIYILVVVLGIMGKIGWELVNKKKVSFIWIIGFSMVAMCVSTLVGLWCNYKGYSHQLTVVLVGSSALFSRDIMMVATQMNWASLKDKKWTEILNLLLNREKNEG